jgi:hypothetical protein
MVRSVGVLSAAAGCLVVAGPAHAGMMALGNSGWTASWPDAFDVQLEVLGEGNGQLMLRKTATFNTVDNVPIVFQQTTADAAAFISITEEALTNNTGSDWGTFRFALLGGSTGTAADPHFDIDATNIDGADGFSINPFTEHAYMDNGLAPDNTFPKMLLLSGGTVANGDIFRPGEQSGALVIATSPNADGENAGQTFVLKELPGVSPTLIPLPSAFWSGLMTLGALGLIGAARPARRHFA